MIGLGLKEFRRHIYTNLFIALQLAAVLFIVILCISGVYSRIELYTPVKEYLECDGAYTADVKIMTEDGKRLEELVPEIDRYIGAYMLELGRDIGDVGLCYAYDDEIIEHYTPKLSEGVWLDEKIRDGKLCAVINFDSGYKLGDTVTKQYSYYREDDVTFSDPETIDVEFVIVGRLMKDAMVFGLNPSTSKNDDHRALYSEYKGKDTILLCSQTAAENKGVGCYRVGHQLVIFKDGLSDEQSQAAVAEINKLTDFAMPLSELRAASQRYVYEQLIRLAPILISVVMLIFVSTVAITTLNMKMNMRTSAIYALHGCTMKGCSMIYLINSLIVAAISVMLCTAFMNILALKGFFEKTVVTVDIHTVIGCAGVCGAFLVCSLVSPVIGLGRASIKEQLSVSE